MTEITDKPKWFWRRVLTYFGFTALLAIAVVGVFKAPDPQWIAVAAIVAAWLMHTVYVTGAVFEDFTRLTRAAAEGLRAAKDTTTL